MLLDAADHDTWSVGSFFVNPFVAPDAGARGLPALRGGRPDQALGRLADRDRPASARATATDHVSVSTKHTLALTNRGDAHDRAAARPGPRDPRRRRGPVRRAAASRGPPAAASPSSTAATSTAANSGSPAACGTATNHYLPRLWTTGSTRAPRAGPCSGGLGTLGPRAVRCDHPRAAARARTVRRPDRSALGRACHRRALAWRVPGPGCTAELRSAPVGGRVCPSTAYSGSRRPHTCGGWRIARRGPR